MPDLSEYCRELESYLCRKNGGHLFASSDRRSNRCADWAERGVPLTMAFRGHRPILRAAAGEGARGAAGADRVLRGATSSTCSTTGAVRSASSRQQATAEALEPTRKPALDGAPRAASSRGWWAAAARGRPVVRAARRSAARARSTALGRIEEIARRRAGGDPRPAGRARRGLVRGRGCRARSRSQARGRREAEAELAPFGARLAPEVRAQAVEAAFERLVRDTLGLPDDPVPVTC